MMQQEEIEEKLNMMEELLQGFIQRMAVIETDLPEFLKNFLQEYKDVLTMISGRIEKSNQRYDDGKIQEQIDELKAVVASVPKMINVRNNHHFGAWSKSLIIGLAVAFVMTAGSFGTALYFNSENTRLNEDAYKFWLVRAMYPGTAESIISELKKDPEEYAARAEKAMERLQAIAAAKALADKADKDQRSARDKLEKVKAGK